jgi:single-strand DNA-binding protein
MNTVCIVGRLTRDPELRHTPSGTECCSLRVAVDRAGPKEGDEVQAGFFDVTYWGKTAENVARYFHKGKQIGVTGSLKWREWEAQDGSKRQGVEINGFSFTFVGSKSDDNGGLHSDSAYAPPAATAPVDDDIPF